MASAHENEARAADLRRQSAEARARAAEYYRQADDRSRAGSSGKSATRCELAQLALAAAERLLAEARRLEGLERVESPGPGPAVDP